MRALLRWYWGLYYSAYEWGYHLVYRHAWLYNADGTVCGLCGKLKEN